MKNRPSHRIIAVSVTGNYHRQKGLMCQDFYAYKRLGRKIVAVIADGAGSAKYGRLGAKYICETLCRLLSTSSEGSIREHIIDAIQITREMLTCHRLNRAKDESGLIDFSATVVGVVYDGKKGLFFHIGDGAAIALKNDKSQQYVISEPENGIFSSETFFFTMEDWKDSLRFTPFTKADSLFLMTDGVTGFALKKDMHTIKDGFVLPIHAFLKSEKNTKRASAALTNTLATPTASRLSGDDKTLMWIDCR